jgi:hypothetical protein
MTKTVLCKLAALYQKVYGPMLYLAMVPVCFMEGTLAFTTKPEAAGPQVFPKGFKPANVNSPPA